MINLRHLLYSSSKIGSDLPIIFPSMSYIGLPPGSITLTFILLTSCSRQLFYFAMAIASFSACIMRSSRNNSSVSSCVSFYFSLAYFYLRVVGRFWVATISLLTFSTACVSERYIFLCNLCAPLNSNQSYSSICPYSSCFSA